MALDHSKRAGKFTSSKMNLIATEGKRKMSATELAQWKKLFPKSRVTTIAGGFLASGLTYIQEKGIERRLGDSIDKPIYSRDMAWGLFMEQIVMNALTQEDLGYKMSSQTTVEHPSLKLGKIWSGSCDVEYYKGGVIERIAEIKCYQKKKFALYTDCILKQDVQLLKKEFAQEYWQIVSNAIIHEVDFGEAISFMPFEREAEYIKGEAEAYEGADAWKYRFIYEEPIENLPFLKNDGYYNNVNQFIFEIPQEDIKHLTKKVEEADKLLLTYNKQLKK